MPVTGTWTQERRERVGRQTHITGFFTLSGTASAGGFAVTASTFGLSSLEDFVPSGTSISATGGTAGIGVTFDKTASTVVLHETGAAVNTPFRESATALTGYLVRGTARGR